MMIFNFLWIEEARKFLKNKKESKNKGSLVNSLMGLVRMYNRIHLMDIQNLYQQQHKLCNYKIKF
jgi:hypothetical protein